MSVARPVSVMPRTGLRIRSISLNANEMRRYSQPMHKAAGTNRCSKGGRFPITGFTHEVSLLGGKCSRLWHRETTRQAGGTAYHWVAPDFFS